MDFVPCELSTLAGLFELQKGKYNFAIVVDANNAPLVILEPDGLCHRKQPRSRQEFKCSTFKPPFIHSFTSDRVVMLELKNNTDPAPSPIFNLNPTCMAITFQSALERDKAYKLMKNYTGINTLALQSPTQEKPEPVKFGDEELSDVIFVVGEQEFYAHKMVLASRSEVFKAMFFSAFKEAKEEKVEIRHVAASTFRRLLELIYNGTISDYYKFSTEDKGFAEYPVSVGNRQSTMVQIIEHDSTDSANLPIFWRYISDLMKVADRYGLMQAVKNYLQLAMSRDVCSKNDCIYCLNSWIFSMEHGLSFRHQKKSFTKATFDLWIQKADENCRGPLDISILRKVLTKCNVIGSN